VTALLSDPGDGRVIAMTNERPKGRAKPTTEFGFISGLDRTRTDKNTERGNEE